MAQRVIGAGDAMVIAEGGEPGGADLLEEGHVPTKVVHHRELAGDVAAAVDVPGDGAEVHGR